MTYKEINSEIQKLCHELYANSRIPPTMLFIARPLWEEICISVKTPFLVIEDNKGVKKYRGLTVYIIINSDNIIYIA